jgi:hypothetical protein
MANVKPSGFGSAITPASTTILVGELADGTAGRFTADDLPVSAAVTTALGTKADASSLSELATADYANLYRTGSAAPTVSARFIGDVWVETTSNPDVVYFAPGPAIGAGAADWVAALPLSGAGNVRVVASGGTAEAWLDVAANSYPAQNTGDTAAESRTDKRLGMWGLAITADGTYPLALWGNIPVTLSEVSASTVAGTCSIKLQKGGVDINGFSSAVAQTTSVTDTASSESIAEDAKLTLVVSSASSLTGLYVTLKGTRTGN